MYAMQKITPFLWIDANVEEAASFYTSVFKNVKLLDKMNGPGGMFMSVTVEIEGQRIILFNGGPRFKLNEATSLFINCETQEEVDHYWERLSEGGEKSRCGWLKDRFGLCWQVIPAVLGEIMSGKEPAKVNNAVQAMMKMDKLVIAELRSAYDNG